MNFSITLGSKAACQVRDIKGSPLFQYKNATTLKTYTIKNRNECVMYMIKNQELCFKKNKN